MYPNQNFVTHHPIAPSTPSARRTNNSPPQVVAAAISLPTLHLLTFRIFALLNNNLGFSMVLRIF